MCLPRRCALRHGREAELLQHAELVDNSPVLREHPVRHAGDVYLVPGRMLAARRHACEVTRHRARGSQVQHNEFTFTEFVDERVLEIREGRPNATYKGLQARTTGWQAWRQGQVLDIALGHHLVDDLKATFVEYLEWDAAHGRPI